MPLAARCPCDRRSLANGDVLCGFGSGKMIPTVEIPFDTRVCSDTLLANGNADFDSLGLGHMLCPRSIEHSAPGSMGSSEPLHDIF